VITRHRHTNARVVCGHPTQNSRRWLSTSPDDLNPPTWPPSQVHEKSFLLDLLLKSLSYLQQALDPLATPGVQMFLHLLPSLCATYCLTQTGPLTGPALRSCSVQIVIFFLQVPFIWCIRIACISYRCVSFGALFCRSKNIEQPLYS
jgi:hypothetical protein